MKPRKSVEMGSAVLWYNLCEPPWRLQLLGLRVVFVWIVTVLLAGCIVVPLPEHTLLGGRGSISEKDRAFLEAGKTTREDVLLQLGEPDLVLSQERSMVYYWQVSHGYFFVGGPGSSAAGPIAKDYLLMLEFDHAGCLARYERCGSVWQTAQAKINAWAGPNAEWSEKRGRDVLVIDPLPETAVRPTATDASSQSVPFTLGEFRSRNNKSGQDLRVGQVKEFGVVKADIMVTRPVIDLVRSAVIGQLEAAGHRLVVQNGDVRIHCEITDFSATSSLGLTTGDAVGSLDVLLEARRKEVAVTRRYQIRQTESRVFGYHSQDTFEKVMRACLEELQRQMAADHELMGFFRSSVTN
jgi:uncharacterized lipoprotein YajG